MRNSWRLIGAVLAIVCLSGLIMAGANRGVVVKPPAQIQPAVVEIGHERSEGQFDPERYRFEMQDRFDWLYSEQVPLWDAAILSAPVSPEDLIAIQDYRCDSCGDDPSASSRVRVGVVKPVSLSVDFSELQPGLVGRSGRLFANGMIQVARDGGFVWTLGVESPNASGVRVHLTDFSLPPDTELYIYNDNNEAFGPYTGKGPNEDGDFWTNTVFGPFAYLQLRHYGRPTAGNLQSVRFRISDVAHMGPNFIVAVLGGAQHPTQNDFCSFNADCVENMACSGYTWSAANTVKYGIAHMLFVSGAYYYICSGGLLNDTDPSSQIPYFLTANHCISRSGEASSLECYWQFWTDNCTTSCYEPYGGVKPRTLGATIMSTNKTGDYTLLKLSQNPPAGSTFLGWSSTAVANTNGVALYRLSHPQGAPMAISLHTVNTSAGTCRSWPRGSWIYSRDTYGATEGGSSGSPVCLADGRVVGQLSGACGTNLNDVCDSVNNATVDGAFASYYSQISQYLNPGTSGGAMHVSSIVLSRVKAGKKYLGQAVVTIVDANGQPVSGATVSGTFSGYYTGTFSAVTGTNGQATIKSASKTGTGSFGFCVGNVTLSGWTYNSAANVETCDNLQ